MTVAELDAQALLYGRHYARVARRTFAECTAADRWPGYSDDEPIIASLPGWVLNRFFEETGL